MPRGIPTNLTVEEMTFSLRTWAKITGLGITAIRERHLKGMDPLCVVTQGRAHGRGCRREPDIGLDELRVKARVYIEAKVAKADRLARSLDAKETKARRAADARAANALKAADARLAKFIEANRAKNEKTIAVAGKRQLAKQMEHRSKLAIADAKADKEAKRALDAHKREVQRINRARKVATANRARMRAAEERRLEKARKVVAKINAEDQRRERLAAEARRAARRKEAAERARRADREPAEVERAIRAEAATRARVRDAQRLARRTMREGIDPRRPSFLYTTCILERCEAA